MSVKFMSKEWEKLMQEKLQEEFSSRGLVSTVFAQIITDAPDGKQLWTLSEIKKGRYVSYTIGEGEPPEYEFAAEGSYETHLGCVQGTVDSVKAITSGQMKLKGNMMKAMSLLGTYSRLEEVEKSLNPV